MFIDYELVALCVDAPLGSDIEKGHLKFKVLPFDGQKCTCSQCFFHGLQECDQVCCTAGNRSDETSVIFKQILPF